MGRYFNPLSHQAALSSGITRVKTFLQGFPCGTMGKTRLPEQGVWVPSLVGN